jgi:hypothetical protein
VLSPDLLAANIDALTSAQGFCPNLGALRDTVRVGMAGDYVRAELRIGQDEWQSVDFEMADSTAATGWLSDARGDGTTQVIVAGSGLGYALDHADKCGLTRVLAIEPDPGLATLFLSRRDWRRWFMEGRLRLLTGPDYRGAADMARFLDGLRDVTVVTHPIRARLEPREVAMATVVGNRVANNARANGEARRKFAGPYLLQTLANLPDIVHSAGVEALDGAFAGTPAILCGAGPSLDANIADLARVADRAVIVAADTALGPLVSAGVAPHLAVAADSSALNARHLTSVSGGDEVMLVAEGSVHPSAFAAFRGRAFTFRVSEHEPWPWLADAGIVRGELRTWGSVLTSAFDLARRMGCNPIVFAGADLAFTGGRPYCRGTIYDAMWQEWIDKGCTWEQMMADYFSRQPEVWLDDVHGQQVRTAPHLVSFRNWLVEQTTAGGGTSFINATGGGILHGGALTQQTLKGVFGSSPAVGDARRVLRERHAAVSQPGDDARRLRRILTEASRSPASLPLERWRQFAASTVTGDQILAALPAPGF